MGKDYYKILGVDKNSCSPEEIKKAYRKLALKWHPDKVKDQNDQSKKEEAQKKFQEISEAFEVLSDPEKKKIYDQVGEEGLKGEVPADAAGGPRSFRFSSSPGGGQQTFVFSSSNADDIFRNFFGTADPFAADSSDSPFGHSGMGGMGGLPFMMGGGRPGMNMHMNGGDAGGMRSSNRPKKAEPVIYPLSVTLEDLYSGAVKKVRITSKRIMDTNGTTAPISSDKVITVKQGWKDGTKITFENEGDESPGIIPADIVFTLQTKPHDRFERDGDDLIHKVNISLFEALCGVKVNVLTLDNRTVVVDLHHVTPDTVKILPGEGMINAKKMSKGDMRIKFKIVFPELNDSERQQIGRILQSNSSAHKSPRK